MIPVSLKPEPLLFDVNVRQPGVAWLTTKGIALNTPPPKKTKFPSYWSKSNKDLWDSYGGICAYLSIYFEWTTGASSTDHFIAKSKNAGLAYEWSNYRLSCLGPNRNKNNYTDVLDPIGMASDTFELNLVSGEIFPSKKLTAVEAALAAKSIKRLKLYSAEHKNMRQRHFSQYIRHKNSAILKELSPFVWHEAHRQGLL